MRSLDPFAVPLSGTSLIEASAGTGKTHTITTLHLRLLLERRLGIEQVLIVTFTKAATAEIKDRARRRLLEAAQAFEGGGAQGELAELVKRSRDHAGDAARLGRAIRSFDLAPICTIHGFCQRALSELAFESGQRFELELVADQRTLLRELCEDFWARRMSIAAECQLAYARARGLGLERWLKLAQVAAAWPDAELLPKPRASDVEPPLARYLAARERVASAWPGAREEVRTKLLDYRVFKRNKHGAARVEAWLGELDALVRRRDRTLEGCDEAVFKLAPPALQAAALKGQRAHEHPFFELCAQLAEAADGARAELEAWRLSLEHDLVRTARAELLDKKHAAGVHTFDDLLLGLARALEGPGGATLAARLRERHPAALVDEFQDTDPVQYRILRSIYGKGEGALYLIGDPKQAIYAFRGADVFSYLGAARDAGSNAWTLGTNHRSDPGLVRAVDTLFSRAEAPFVLRGIEFSSVAPKPGARDRLWRAGLPAAPVEIAFVPWEPGAGRDGERITKDWRALPGRIASHVRELLCSGMLLDDRPLEPGDLAILTRTNRQAFDIQAELRRRRIPSVLLGDQSVLDSPEADELARVLAALAAPSEPSALLGALSTSLFATDAHELASLRDDELGWERRVEAFRRWREAWQRHGLPRAVRAILRESGAMPRLLGRSDGDRKLTNFLHLTELLHRVASAEHLGIGGLRRWFQEVRFDVGKRGEMAPDAQQIRLESDERAVKLTTMHKSKGLEYSVVLCPYLWDGTHVSRDEVVFQLHDAATDFAPQLYLGPLDSSAPERAQVETERRAENMRLCYVALTRAKHRTTVLWGTFRTAPGAPLAELLHAPDPGSNDQRPAGERIALAGTSELRNDLGRLLAAAPSSFELSELAPESSIEWPSTSKPVPSEPAREILRRVEARWRSSSFSALAAGHELISLPASIGKDVDESTGEVAPATPAPAPEPALLSTFPRGARAGNALHELLEKVDFAASSPAERSALAAAALARHGIEAEHLPAATAALDQVLATPLLDAPPALRLADVPRERRLSELEFTFPISPGAGGRLGPESLARVFAAHPAGLPDGYPTRLSRLGFAPLAGYLRGFVDLVFEHEGRFYVADYKSNYLGPKRADYAREHLERAMADHHYVLQAHLYTLALHRYLARRSSDYDYEKSFGGALYLFLRGMSPDRPGSGVYFDRPPLERLRALDVLVGKAGS